jgi:hypothetical protein
MKSEDFTLIGVLKERGSYDKYVKKEFANYTGKYVLATERKSKTNTVTLTNTVISWIMKGKQQAFITLALVNLKPFRERDTLFWTEKPIKSTKEKHGPAFMLKRCRLI